VKLFASGKEFIEGGNATAVATLAFRRSNGLRGWY
jgi:hypothetical protein